MTGTWMIILMAMIAGSFILNVVPAGLYLEGVMGVNLGILLIAYLCFRRDPFIDMRANMLFMLGLTVINIMTDLGMMSVALSWVAFGALFIWSMMGGGRSR
jgi:hypothetical protein